MPSGPKKRAKAKKKLQRLGSVSLNDDLDSRSRSSDDKETDTCDSVDDQEEDSIPKSPLGKSAYSAGENYHKSETEKWVRVSNFEVGLPTPRSEHATIDFEQVMDDELNGTKSPDWETVDRETVGSLGKKGDNGLAVNHGVKPQELEAVLKSAEMDYFSFGSPPLSSRDDCESATVGDSLVVEPGTEVADYSVGSGTIPYDPSLPDSEGQAENGQDCTSRSSQLSADLSTEPVDDAAQGRKEELSIQDFSKERVEENASDVRLREDDLTQGAEEKSVVLASGEQDLHEQVEHEEIVDPNRSRLGSNRDVGVHHRGAAGNLTYSAEKSGRQSLSTGEPVGSVSAGLHPSADTVAGVSEVDDKSLAQELVATPSDVGGHQAEVETEEQDLYEAAECPEVQDDDEYEYEELKAASEINDEPSTSFDNLKGIPDDHVASSSYEGHFTASTPSIADGESAEERTEKTASEVTVEFPGDVPPLGYHLTGTNGELEETTEGVVKHLPHSSSSKKVVCLTDAESPAAEVGPYPNGDHVKRQSSTNVPATAERTLSTGSAEAPAQPVVGGDSAKVEVPSKLQTSNLTDGTPSVGVTSTQSAVSDLQPNNGVVTVDHQVKDIRRDSSPGCCGALYWIFGQAD